MSITTKLRPRPLPFLAFRLIQAQLGEWSRQVAHALGPRRETAYWLSDLKIPDSELAQKATELVTEVSPIFLVNHSFRTYFFGAALGLRDGISFDNEVLYLAAIMHDLGLTARFQGHAPFELDGAQAARAFALEHRCDPARADLIHEAIALHTSIGDDLRRGTEGILLQLGSGLDVVGLRFRDLSRKAVNEILAFYPRLDFKTQFITLAKEKVERKPDCPLAALMKLGFFHLVRAARFLE